tara:strand:- start:43 stop:309 length:267 start_codon:yes stop_codon:yes gene_type:complete
MPLNVYKGRAVYPTITLTDGKDGRLLTLDVLEAMRLLGLQAEYIYSYSVHRHQVIARLVCANESAYLEAQRILMDKLVPGTRTDLDAL